jgi:hypothetical protein
VLLQGVGLRLQAAQLRGKGGNEGAHVFARVRRLLHDGLALLALGR